MSRISEIKIGDTIININCELCIVTELYSHNFRQINNISYELGYKRINDGGNFVTWFKNIKIVTNGPKYLYE